MRTREDIEAYLIRSGAKYSEVEDDMWVVYDAGSTENIVVRMTGPLVLFRVKVLELSTIKRHEELYGKLLELNAEDMVHGAYGIANDAIVLTCAMRLENLDYNEFQGTIDDFSLALTNHYEMLASFRDAA
jgi:hypothetical protein